MLVKKITRKGFLKEEKAKFDEYILAGQIGWVAHLELFFRTRPRTKHQMLADIKRWATCW